MMNFKQFKDIPAGIKDKFYTFALGEICSDFDHALKPTTIIEIIASEGHSELYTICESFEGNSGKTLASIIESLAESQYYNVTRMVATEEIYQCLESGHYVHVNTCTADTFKAFDDTLTIDDCDTIAQVVFLDLDTTDVDWAIEEYLEQKADLYSGDIK